MLNRLIESVLTFITVFIGVCVFLGIPVYILKEYVVIPTIVETIIDTTAYVLSLVLSIYVFKNSRLHD